MKKIIVYFLLFIFTIQSTKSLWIITSFQINRDYIAANLCINRFDKIPVCKGQCYLDNQLNKEQKENKKNLTTVEKEYLFIAPSFAVTAEKKYPEIISKTAFSFYNETAYNSHTLIFDSPPELVS